MGEAEKGKGPMDLYPAERVRHGRRALDLQAKQESEARKAGPAAVQGRLLGTRFFQEAPSRPIRRKRKLTVCPVDKRSSANDSSAVAPNGR